MYTHLYFGDNAKHLGVMYCGIIEALSAFNVRVNTYTAHSTGAIFAGALACGATSEIIRAEMLNVDFRQSDKQFMQWYSGVLTRLTARPKITLREVYEIYGKRIIIGADKLDYRTDPNLELRKAVFITIMEPTLANLERSQIIVKLVSDRTYTIVVNEPLHTDLIGCGRRRIREFLTTAPQQLVPTPSAPIDIPQRRC